MKQTLLLICILFSTVMIAQIEQPPATPAQVRLDGFKKRQALIDNSLVKELPFRSVGPTVFSGRVADIDVHPDDPTIFYVAYASGGLWKTENNGTSFTPIMDQEMVMTIGDIAVDWENNVIWVGTGENNSSRSSYSGVGIFKSTDGGKSWIHMGLPESHHIGRIILHPTDPKIAWVAVLGHLYSPNLERGIYKTADGGKTWVQTLFANENAGAIDLIADPQNPATLYAATWHRERRAWDFVESGEGTGIYKSTDGGNSWNLITTDKSGFPRGSGAGRIGLCMTYDNEKPVIFAVIDNYDRRPKEKKEEDKDKLTKDDLRGISAADFAKLEEKKVAEFLKTNRFPEKYSAKKVSEMIEKGEIKPDALVEYLEDANSLLFDTPVVGAEVYRSDDGGKKWKKTHKGFLDAVFNSYGYYFGQIRVAKGNPQKLYTMGVPVLRSDDGGKNWVSINGDNVHVDHHALWVNPNRPGHLILGNDGGINISYDDGEHWVKCNSPALGQFYAVAVDMEKPYNIYGGLQDNGVWYGPSTYKAGREWNSTGDYPYDFLLGGDGMQVAVDTRDNNIVYTGFQFGNYYRINKKTGDRKYIQPKHDLGERPLRWNWQSPIHLSIHNQDILYFGSNKLHRSLNQGDDFKEISGDLTTGGIQGDVAYSTLSCIHESPLKFGLLYVGSDDGLVHVSKDGGNSWVQINDGLPERMWVTRVQASVHKEGRVYLSLNGYRWDDFSSYVYVSEDYGKNWKAIGTDLPAEPVNVIKEDADNENLVYVGTDHGIYLSLDRGESFMALQGGLPAVAVHDLVIHPREKDLIVATHGRSFYLGAIQPVQEMTKELLAEPLHVFSPEKIKASSRWGQERRWYSPKEAPKTTFTVYAKTAGTASLEIKAEDLLLAKQNVELKKGLNYLDYDLMIKAEEKEAYETWLNKDRKEDKLTLKKADDGNLYIRSGKYLVKVTADGKEAKVDWTVE